MATRELTALRCVECSIDNCKCIQKLVYILQEYQSWLYHENNKQENTVISLIERLSISCKIILKFSKHIKQNNYTLSNDNLLCRQSLTKCICIERHKRDNHKQYESLYNTKDIKQILLQKLLDQIHLFLYHPLDIKRRNLNDNNQRFGTNVEEQKEINLSRPNVV